MPSGKLRHRKDARVFQTDLSRGAHLTDTLIQPHHVASRGEGYHRIRLCADDILYLPRGLFFYLGCFTLYNFQFKHPL